MEDEIVKAYYKYYDTIMEQNLKPDGYLQVVIKITPKTFSELIGTGKITIFRDEICYYTELCGLKTPFIIEKDLPENVEFVIQSRKDYERIEQENLLKKWFKMFGNI